MRLLILLTLIPPALALSPQAKQGRAVLIEAQCNRCHAIGHAGGEGVPNAQRDMHCVDCHTWILGTKGDAKAIEAQREIFPDWDRYLETIVHFTRLPDLGTLTRRVDPAYVRRFLDGPHDLRPHLRESMIPVRLGAQQKDALVAYLAELNGGGPGSAKPGPAPTAARIAEGRSRFIARGCPTCHVVGNERAGGLGFDAKFYAAMGAKALLAPDLRHTRERIPRAALVRFISDPLAVDPQSAMPKQTLQPGDAEAIADFLLHTPLKLEGPVSVTPSIPTLTRKVGWDEVFDEVLGKICVHCHMRPESNNGDGGAGNTGGLGYAGVALELETYEGVKRGLKRGGKRVSVLKPEAPGKPPLLVDALIRRYAEAPRDARPLGADARSMPPPTDAQRPGMPLGLPPLDAKQIALLQAWIAQGAPGPL